MIKIIVESCVFCSYMLGNTVSANEKATTPKKWFTRIIITGFLHNTHSLAEMQKVVYTGYIKIQCESKKCYI